MEGRRDRATSQATARAIRAAWRDGRLGGSDNADAAPRIELLGMGETYAAWHLVPRNGPALVVRVATRAPGDMARPMSQEAAALPHLPPGAGPRLVAACHQDGPESPLGLPYLVTTHLPGRVLAPGQWGRRQLSIHAAALARLHRARFPGRGAFGRGNDPLGALAPGPMSLLAEFDTAMAWWREDQPDLWDAALDELVAAARAVCAAAEPAFGELDDYPLVHGDLCATNVLWDGDTPHYIDFEWAQADDPARDLALIGGTVHAGPWYVPLDDGGIDQLVNDYADESARLGQALDRTALRLRRDGWEAYERTAMLVYLTRCAREGRDGYDGFARSLGARLAARVGTRRRV